MMFFGAHISIAKGFTHAIREAHKIGANTMQFFTRNPRGSKAKAIDPEDVATYSKLTNEFGFGPVVAHAPYTLNLASVVPETFEFAHQTLADDLIRMDTAGVPYIAMHPGSHLGAGVDAAIERISEGLNLALQENGNTMVILETMAGMGTEVGFKFNQMKKIIDGCKFPDRVGVCMDSCHLFAAGFDIVNRLDDVLEQFDKAVGLDKLRAFHLNDSKYPLGSKKDRHADLGEGMIGVEALKNLVLHPQLQHIPFLLETPGGLGQYEKEIQLLRSWEKFNETR